MSIEALGLVLAAASLHATWNVFLRGSGDMAARTAVMLTLAVLLFAPAAAASWSVSSAAAPYITASSVLHGVYFGLLVMAYRRQELSVVYPIARGSAPVLVLLGSAGVLGRPVSPSEVGGVCLVAVGILFVRGLRGGQGLGVGLAIGATTAAYTLVDNDGIRHAGAVSYLELVQMPLALGTLSAVVARQGTTQIRAELSPLTALAALASFGAYALVLVALRLAPAPLVAAVRETSVLIAIAVAALVLRERVTLPRLVGAAIVAGGVALLALS